jgi:hypothetical protein
MRLVFVSHSGKLGGAELFLCELVSALQRRVLTAAPTT